MEDYQTERAVRLYDAVALDLPRYFSRFQSFDSDLAIAGASDLYDYACPGMRGGARSYPSEVLASGAAMRVGEFAVGSVEYSAAERLGRVAEEIFRNPIARSAYDDYLLWVDAHSITAQFLAPERAPLSSGERRQAEDALRMAVGDTEIAEAIVLGFEQRMSGYRGTADEGGKGPGKPAAAAPGRSSARYDAPTMPSAASSGPTMPMGDGPTMPVGGGPAMPTSGGPTMPVGGGPAMPTSGGPTMPMGAGPTMPMGSGPAMPMSGGPTMPMSGGGASSYPYGGPGSPTPATRPKRSGAVVKIAVCVAIVAVAFCVYSLYATYASITSGSSGGWTAIDSGSGSTTGGGRGASSDDTSNGGSDVSSDPQQTSSFSSRFGEVSNGTFINEDLGFKIVPNERVVFEGYYSDDNATMWLSSSYNILDENGEYAGTGRVQIMEASYDPEDWFSDDGASAVSTEIAGLTFLGENTTAVLQKENPSEWTDTGFVLYEYVHIDKGFIALLDISCNDQNDWAKEVFFDAFERV